MKRVSNGMSKAATIMLCMGLVACGGSDDDDSGGATETSMPAPTNGEEINVSFSTALDGTWISNCAAIRSC